jgi:tripartite-type tricarboxylate transporter receptor subunit TctC
MTQLNRGEQMTAHRILLAFIIAALSGFALNAAGAEKSYATKPLRFIVPYAPGGGADIMARTIQPKLVTVLGQQIVIDNRPGAGGNIGADVAAKAPANGYTLFMGTGNFSMAPSLFGKLPFDPLHDFTAVSLLAETPSILAVNPGLPAKSVKELIALARAAPGKINYASDGGGPLQLFVELLKTMAKIDMTNIPYSSTGPAVLAVMSGEASVVMAPAPAVIPHTKSGRLRAIAISSARRLDAMPELPTVAESGVPGFDANQWYGILVPAGTPAAIVAELNRDCVNIMHMTDIKERLANDVSIAIGSTPHEFAQFLRDDIAKWAAAAKYSGAHSR